MFSGRRADSQLDIEIQVDCCSETERRFGNQSLILERRQCVWPFRINFRLLIMAVGRYSSNAPRTHRPIRNILEFPSGVASWLLIS